MYGIALRDDILVVRNSKIDIDCYCEMINILSSILLLIEIFGSCLKMFIKKQI